MIFKKETEDKQTKNAIRKASSSFIRARYVLKNKKYQQKEGDKYTYKSKKEKKEEGKKKEKKQSQKGAVCLGCGAVYADR